jgi:hypothetical protein
LLDHFSHIEEVSLMASASTTTDHDKIRKWVEDHDGQPAVVRTKGEGGILRIDFGEPEENLEEVSWEEFFDIFENSSLAFLYEEKGGDSRFNKFVSRH